MNKVVEPSFQRGGVYLVQLDPRKGMEVGKLRPYVVVQSDILNEAGMKTVVVVPLSSRFQPETAFLRVQIAAREGLLKPSVALVEHIRGISISRMKPEKLTQLTESEMDLLFQKLDLMMGRTTSLF